MDQVQTNLLQDQSTRRKPKKFFFIFIFIFLIILFILIITAIISVFTILKNHTQSQSSIQTIRAACRLTPYYNPCITSISSLHKTHSLSSKIDASYIFGLSNQAAYYQFYNISTLPEKLASKFKNQEIEPALWDCQNLFNTSFSHLHKTKNFHGQNEKIWANQEMVKSLRILIESAIYDMKSCVDELEAKGMRWRNVKAEVEVKTYKAKAYMVNSLAILENRYAIEKMIYPGFQSILDSFILSREHFGLSIFLFCLQYLVLIFLFCCLLRVLISRSR